MGGRKAHYTTRIAKRLCEHIALGATVAEALQREPLAPTVPTFWRWLDEYPEFQEMYQRARKLQADLAADTILTMAKNVLENPRFAPAYKVASDILRWHAEMNNPQRYSPKMVVEHKSTPLDPTKLKGEIKQLEKELGMLGHDADVVDVTAKEVNNGEA